MNLRTLPADVYLALLRTGRHRERLERDIWIERRDKNRERDRQETRDRLNPKGHSRDGKH